MSKLTPLNELDKFMNGALQERVAREFSNVIANIYDMNTKPDSQREVTIKLVIKPNKSRKAADVIAKITSKLAPLTDLETAAEIGTDADGVLVMVEQTGIPDGQMNMDGETHQNNVARFQRV